MTLTTRKKKMRRRSPECINSSSRRSMRRTSVTKKNKIARKRMNADAEKRSRWRMQLDTFRESGNGSKKLENS